MFVWRGSNSIHGSFEACVYVCRAGRSSVVADNNATIYGTSYDSAKQGVGAVTAGLGRFGVWFSGLPRSSLTTTQTYVSRDVFLG